MGICLWMLMKLLEKEYEKESEKCLKSNRALAGG